MEIERAAVHRALRTSRAHDLNIIRSGIGKEAIVAALERACIGARPALVILAGACGALRTTDEVPVIARIIDTTRFVCVALKRHCCALTGGK